MFSSRKPQEIEFCGNLKAVYHLMKDELPHASKLTRKKTTCDQAALGKKVKHNESKSYFKNGEEQIFICLLTGNECNLMLRGTLIGINLTSSSAPGFMCS